MEKTLLTISILSAALMSFNSSANVTGNFWCKSAFGSESKSPYSPQNNGKQYVFVNGTTNNYLTIKIDPQNEAQPGEEPKPFCNDRDNICKFDITFKRDNLTLGNAFLSGSASKLAGGVIDDSIYGADSVNKPIIDKKLQFFAYATGDDTGWTWGADNGNKTPSGVCLSMGKDVKPEDIESIRLSTTNKSKGDVETIYGVTFNN